MKRSATAARTTVRVLVNTVLTVVLLGSAAFVLPGFLGYQRYVITSGSMTGTYDVGSIVFDEPVATGSLAEGDVITYLPPPVSGVPHLVTHRIVDIREGRSGATAYRTRGDANPQADPWTFHLDRAVQPKVVYSVPYAGYVFLALADRHVRMPVVGVPAALLALTSLVQLVRALRPARRRAGFASTVATP
jgi:signal peptidase I